MTTNTELSDEQAPANGLPTWEECALRVSNSDFIAKRVAEGGYGPEPDSLLASQLHRFIYEYDDMDPYRSAWFMHRLELLLNEVRAEARAAIPAASLREQQGGVRIVECSHCAMRRNANTCPVHRCPHKHAAAAPSSEGDEGSGEGKGEAVVGWLEWTGELKKARTLDSDRPLVVSPTAAIEADVDGGKGAPLVPCPVCGGEAVHAHDMLARTFIMPSPGVMDMDEASAKRISDALRAMQEMWDMLRRKGLNDVLVREYSNALEVLEKDFQARLHDGVDALSPTSPPNGKTADGVLDTGVPSIQGYRVDASYFQKWESIPVALRDRALALYAYPHGVDASRGGER